MSEAATEYVPAELLNQLADDLTVSDIWHARTEWPEGDFMRGFGAIYYAAKRTGHVNGESADEFMARVRIADVGPAMARAAETLGKDQTAGASLPGSVGSGE